MKRLIPLMLMLSTAACQAVSPGEPESKLPASAVSGASVGGEGAIPDLAFAQAACGDCHGLARNELSPNPAAPAFSEIANRDGLTTITLSTWLRDAHNYPEAMDFDLTEARAEALTAYILTLRDPAYRPPIY